MLYYGHQIFEEDNGTFSVAVGGWVYECKTVEEAKKHIRDHK